MGAYTYLFSEQTVFLYNGTVSTSNRHFCFGFEGNYELEQWRLNCSRLGVFEEGIVLIKDVWNSSQATEDSFLPHQLLQNMSPEPCPYPKFLVICISVRSLTLYYRHPTNNPSYSVGIASEIHLQVAVYEVLWTIGFNPFLFLPPKIKLSPGNQNIRSYQRPTAWSIATLPPVRTWQVSEVWRPPNTRPGASWLHDEAGNVTYGMVFDQDAGLFHSNFFGWGWGSRLKKLTAT